MKTRKLEQNREVAALGLGCMGMSANYGPTENRQDMIALMRAAVDIGVARKIPRNWSDVKQAKSWKGGV